MKKPLIAALVAASTLLAAGAAQASHVRWSIGINLPGPALVGPGYYAPPAYVGQSYYAPPVYGPEVVYSQPAPAYYAPTYRSYYRAPVVYRAPVYYRHAGYGNHYHGGYGRSW